MKVPMPGSKVNVKGETATVIASQYHSDDVANVLVLLPTAPFYGTVLVDLDKGEMIPDTDDYHDRIDEAVREYDD